MMTRAAFMRPQAALRSSQAAVLLAPFVRQGPKARQQVIRGRDASADFFSWLHSLHGFAFAVPT